MYMLEFFYAYHLESRNACQLSRRSNANDLLTVHDGVHVARAQQREECVRMSWLRESTYL